MQQVPPGSAVVPADLTAPVYESHHIAYSLWHTAWVFGKCIPERLLLSLFIPRGTAMHTAFLELYLWQK